MLIVLEGCDGAGKTTLAQQLVKEAELRGWEGEVWHRGVPMRHPLEEYEWDLEQDYARTPAERSRRLLVADRWHLGQLVYGPLYRKDLKDFDLACAWHVDAKLQSLGAVQLIMSPPLEVIRERLAIRGEDYLKEGHVQYVHEAYESMTRCRCDEFTGSPLSCIGHGFFSRSFSILRESLDDDDVRVLVDTAACRSERVDALTPFSTYVGPRYPEILLLGDRHNGSDRREPEPTDYDAAFVPYGGTSGRWLCQTIVQTSLHEHNIGVANANQEDVWSLTEALHHPKIVALGQLAHDALVNRGIVHGWVPHPQFARRFHHDNRSEYAGAILEAATSEEKVVPLW